MQISPTLQTGVQSKPTTAPSQPATRPSPSPRATRNFTTALITDSIMKNISEDALGNNHTLHMIQKYHAEDLSDRHMRGKLLRMKPDFIYVHVGLNDMLKGKTANTIISYLMDFSCFVEDHLRNTRLIYSLPILINKDYECRGIVELRNLVFSWFSDMYATNAELDVEDRKIIYNSNSNFINYRLGGPRNGNMNSKAQLVQTDGLFSNDGIHLNPKGKSTILANFRHAIHDLTRRILHKSNSIPR